MEKISRQSPFGYCIFCEDIRQEISGKQTYVGVFPSPEIHVLGNLPTNIGKFCIAIFFSQRPNQIAGDVKIQVLLPGQEGKPAGEWDLKMKEILEAMPPAPAGRDDPLVGVNIACVFNPLNIQAEGDITVRAVLGDKWHPLGAIRVVAAPSEGGKQLRAIASPETKTDDAQS